MTLIESLIEANEILVRVQKQSKKSQDPDAYVRIALKTIIAKGIRAREIYPEL